VCEVYGTPLLELVFHAAGVHRMYNDPAMVRGARGRLVGV
jgi:biotin synthase